MTSRTPTIEDADPTPDWKPSNNQRALLDMAMRSDLSRGIRAICQDAGISRQTFYKWMKDLRFATLWRDVPAVNLLVERRIGDIERRLENIEVEVARLQDVAKLLKVK